MLFRDLGGKRRKHRVFTQLHNNQWGGPQGLDRKVEKTCGLSQFQHNAWIHLLSALLVIFMGFYMSLSITEWCFIVFAIGFVFVAEIINTSIEYLTDLVSPNYHEKAKKVKDLAAGGVLIASIIALSIGLIIFLPKLL